MDRLALVSFLEKNHFKRDIEYITKLVIDGSISVVDVFNLSFDDDSKIAFRAAWCLENIAFTNLNNFLPVLSLFSEKYHIQHNLSARRHFSKIALLLLQKKSLLEIRKKSSDYFPSFLEASFDWLTEINAPLAVQCNCLDIIHKLSDQEDWVLVELMSILENNLLSSSPAILSRTKAILAKHKRNKGK